MSERCRNPCWNPLLEPLCALEPYAGTLLEPPFCAGTPPGTHPCALLVIFGNSTWRVALNNLGLL